MLVQKYSSREQKECVRRKFFRIVLNFIINQVLYTCRKIIVNLDARIVSIFLNCYKSLLRQLKISSNSSIDSVNFAVTFKYVSVINYKQYNESIYCDCRGEICNYPNYFFCSSWLQSQDMFSVAAHRSKTTMRLSEICRLCLCPETMFLPLYNSAENLHEKIHTISSRVKVSCSGKVMLVLIQWYLLTP